MASSSAKSIFSSPHFTSFNRSSPSKSPLLSFPKSSVSLNLHPLHSSSSSSNRCNFIPLRSVLKTVESSELEVQTSDLLDPTFPNDRSTILVAEKLGEAGLKLLRSFGNVECAYDLSPEDLCAKISSCDALIVRSGTKVNRQVFEAAKGRLKVVGRAGVGIDNVDLQAATEFGCLVVNAPTANTIAAAEHGIALLTAMARNVAQADASTKAGR